ncbi:hypothetical protein BTVI_124798 [Pitangus sulphuratus]|nr:hypothetical protein BTVI_124798 [Pitangus sulphuratus]
MEETEEEKKDEADYKRLHSFPLIRHSDMPEEMRVETMELCVTACEKFATNNESAAKMIKETMDKKFGSSWHVVIGEGFGFEITHEVKNLLYMFFGGSLAVWLPLHEDSAIDWHFLQLEGGKDYSLFLNFLSPLDSEEKMWHIFGHTCNFQGSKVYGLEMVPCPVFSTRDPSVADAFAGSGPEEATKVSGELEHLWYEDRLKGLELFSLKKRGLQRDLTAPAST